MEIILFIFSGPWIFIGTLILIGLVLSGIVSIIRLARGMPEPREVIDCSDILERVEGGIFKRIDENRELVELIQSEAPALFSKYPWALGWLKSQDRFLTALSETDDFDPDECKFTPQDDEYKSMPRPIPQWIR